LIEPIVPPEHVVVLYESVRARASAGEVVRLSIDGDEADEELDVEIEISGATAQDLDRRLSFKTSSAGELRFSRQVNGVSVDASTLDVVIGSGNPVEMIAPVSLNIGRLTFNCSELAVQLGDTAVPSGDTIIIIEAQELLTSGILTAPLVRKGAELAISWPEAMKYPWTHFAVFWNDEDAENIDDTLRGLRRLILAFRSHSRGRLARFEDKIEHRRITKGTLGVAIRERMMKDEILTLEGNMYFLDPVKLGKLVGATYQDLNLKKFNKQMRTYASSIT
jgi:hypothetical protein